MVWRRRGVVMDELLGKLNPLLRLAAISGVETAVKLHIRRGDDLNARDAGGATPLMLAAGRRRLGAVRLLLDAGANAALTDSAGRDALAYAKSSGCIEAIALLEEVLRSVEIAPRCEDQRPTYGQTEIATEHESATTNSIIPADDQASREVYSEVTHRAADASELFRKSSQVDENSSHESPGTTVADAGTERFVSTRIPPSRDPFVLGALITGANNRVAEEEPLDFDGEWEAEVEAVAPESDYAVADAVKLIHETI